MTASEKHIESVAKRLPPFGKNLRRAVQKTLAGAMKIKAEIEFASGSSMPSELVCQVEHRHDVNEVGSNELGGDSQVDYTLVAYTDSSNGCLLYKQKINRSGVHRVPVPRTFGKICVHLISSMVGLDGKWKFR